MTTAHGRTWPTREQWARDRRTVYADDIDQAADAVSTSPADYATPTEITRAAAELGDHWRLLGTQLREANRAALAVFPFHGHRARRRASIHAILRERGRLSADAQRTVEHAEALKHHRQIVNSALSQLTGTDGTARLHLWTVNNTIRRMDGTVCPTWKTIVARWHTAREAAADAYRAQVAARPVDDDAWAAEIRRRAEIEQGSTIHAAPAAMPSPGRLAQKPPGLSDAQYRKLMALDRYVTERLATLRQARP